ncbi:MAG: dihydrodipicolinate synthase family protein [Sphaerochaetaceae bacterium]|nr:dihydrodipicolinate synthase family protein [Sphaerochaetaceae bacterium]
MKGIFVASLTPFDKDGKLNAAALEKLMERNLKEGAAGFFMGGSSAECFLLTHEERVAAFEVASQFKNRTELIAHIGAISTEEAVKFGKEAKALGFGHIAATPPLYYGFTPKEIASYYYDIADKVGMPVIVYNFPGNTKKEFDLSNPVYRELFTSSAIEGVKHTNQVVYQMERFLNLNPSLVVLNGFDETMVAGLALGAHGSIGSTFNCMLPHYLKIYNAFNSGEIAKAREMQHKANTIMETFCNVGLIPAVKYVVCKQGIDVGIARRPFGELSPEAMRMVDKALEENLIK